MQTQLALLLLTLPLVAEVTCTSSPALNYELIFQTTREDGSVILKCRNCETADEVNVQNVNFWLNRSTEYNQDLREREDFGTLEAIDQYSIKFRWQQSLEGYYTCGTSSKQDGAHESPPLTLISLQTSGQDRIKVRTNFTAISGSTAILDCPNKPGALLQYYSVRWMKNSTMIASFSDSEGFNSTDPRYNIDRSTFALIISSVTMIDSGKGYQCEVYVRNPSTGDKHPLPPHNDLVKLHIYGKGRISPGKFVVTKDEDKPSFNCTIEYTGPTQPNITWSYISEGVETNIACRHPDYKITQNLPWRENGRSILRSTLTFLDLDKVEKQDVVVVRCRSGTTPAESDAYLVKGCRNLNGTAALAKSNVRNTGTDSTAASQETASRTNMSVDTFNKAALAFGVVGTCLSSVSLLLLILAGMIWYSNHRRGERKQLEDTSSQD